MPYLKTLLVNANEKSDEALGRNTLQCIISVGMAVGQEKFRKDLKQVFSQLSPILLFIRVSWVTYISSIYIMPH